MHIEHGQPQPVGGPVAVEEVLGRREEMFFQQTTLVTPARQHAQIRQQDVEPTLVGIEEVGGGFV